MATKYEAGTLLTCTHEGCGCRVLIQEECNCEGADSANYTCACGAPLVPVTGS
jgi:metallothionein